MRAGLGCKSTSLLCLIALFACQMLCRPVQHMPKVLHVAPKAVTQQSWTHILAVVYGLAEEKPAMRMFWFNCSLQLLSQDSQSQTNLSSI